jgi:3D (Asp-Asp-Asp) domain-containing protein
MQYRLAAVFTACFLLVSPVLAAENEPSSSPLEEHVWVAVHRTTGLWSSQRSNAALFRTVQPGAVFRAVLPQRGPRLHVWDPSAENYAYIDGADVGPVGDPEAAPTEAQQWVSVHRATGLWSNRKKDAVLFRTVQPGASFRLVAPQKGDRLHVWDPSTENYAYVDAIDVGPSGPPVKVAEQQETIQPINFIWSGLARVTMYSCVELGGCGRTAMGLWPYEGVVAVDPRVIPLGSTVWLEGLGLFLAADTGSAVRGNHVDVFVNDYGRARNWGIRYLNGAAYWPQ